MAADVFAGFELIDLTLPIYNGAPIWSAEPQCIVHDWFKKGRHYGRPELLNMKYFCIAGHQGTHTDAPFHLNNDGVKLDQIPLRRYMGWARCLDFRAKKLGDHFTAADMKEHRRQAWVSASCCTPAGIAICRPSTRRISISITRISRRTASTGCSTTRSSSSAWMCRRWIRASADHPKIFERLDQFPDRARADDQPRRDRRQGGLPDVPADEPARRRRLLGAGRRHGAAEMTGLAGRRSPPTTPWPGAHASYSDGGPEFCAVPIR